MEVSLDDLRNIAALGSSFLAIGTAIYAWLTSRSKINAEEIHELRTSVGSLSAKVQALEQTLKQMPDKDTVHALDMKVTELNGGLGVMAEALKSVERTAHRIESFLLDQAKK